MATIVTNEKGFQVVEINTIIFSGKRRIDWTGVETYLKKYVRYHRHKKRNVVPRLGNKPYGKKPHFFLQV